LGWMMWFDMWEILVPYHWNDGTKIPIGHHEQWDARVCEMTNGLMLRGTAFGRWGLHKEKMIMVHIACDALTITRIHQLTKEHYQQEAVFYRKLAGPAFVG
jgi:hypothetical protein